MPKKEYKYHRVTFTYDGKRYERKGRTLAEAHEKAAELKAALRRGEIGISGGMTVARWAYEWLETYKAHSVRAGHLENYNLYLNVVIKAIGSKRLKDGKRQIDPRLYRRGSICRLPFFTEIIVSYYCLVRKIV